MGVYIPKHNTMNSEPPDTSMRKNITFHLWSVWSIPTFCGDKEKAFKTRDYMTTTTKKRLMEINQ